MERHYETVWWNEQPYEVLRNVELHRFNRLQQTQSAFAILLYSVESTVGEYAKELYIYWDGLSANFEFIQYPENIDTVIFDITGQSDKRVYFSDAYSFVFEYVKNHRLGQIATNYCVNGLSLAFELTNESQSNNSVGMVGDFVGISLSRISPRTF